jgi:hypothetical protein
MGAFQGAFRKDGIKKAPNMPLTDKACKNAKPKDKTYKLFDSGGLYLEVTPKGGLLWRLKYRYLNKEKKLCIGPYPTITLAEARQHRDEARKLIINGQDPSAVKHEIKQERIQEGQNTYEVIAREWHEHKKAEWSEVNADTTLKRLEKDVFPHIGKYPIKIITHKMLLDTAQITKERGAHELAKRIIQICKHIYQYAIITGRAEKNIAEDLKGIIKPKPQGHHAAMPQLILKTFPNL